MKRSPALARVWLSKKFSPYNQDPKEFAAMLLLSPWVVLGPSRSCGPAGAACQASIPLQGVCVSQDSFSSPVWPQCPTHPLWVWAHPQTQSLPLSSASSKRDAGLIFGVGHWCTGISRQSDICEFTSETPDPSWGVNLGQSLLQYIHASCKRPLVATNFQAGLISFPCWMINSVFSHYFVKIQAEREDACVWLQAEFGSMSK